MVATLSLTQNLARSTVTIKKKKKSELKRNVNIKMARWRHQGRDRRGTLILGTRSKLTRKTKDRV